MFCAFNFVKLLKLFFNVFFECLFWPSWNRFWTPCWAYVGSFFELFSAIKMRSYLEVVLALIFHRFKTPSNLKNWALAYPKMQFSTFNVCYLKFVLGLDFGPQMAPKIESKSLQNPFGNEVEILVKLNVDFESNLEANLGPKRPQNFQNKSPSSVQGLL